MTANSYVALAGSHRDAKPDAVPAGPVNKEEAVRVTVRLRPGPQSDATPDDAAQVSSFAAAFGLETTALNLPLRNMELAGKAGDFEKAFKVALDYYAHDDKTFRGRVGPVQVPADLAEIVTSVHGLDNRPVAKPHFRIRQPAADAGLRHPFAAVSSSFTPPQLAALYDFPTDVTGAGQKIALIELGGGFVQADLDAYSKRLGLPSAAVQIVSVDGGRNAPDGAKWLARNETGRLMGLSSGRD